MKSAHRQRKAIAIERERAAIQAAHAIAMWLHEERVSETDRIQVISEMCSQLFDSDKSALGPLEAALPKFLSVKSFAYFDRPFSRPTKITLSPGLPSGSLTGRLTGLRMTGDVPELLNTCASKRQRPRMSAERIESQKRIMAQGDVGKPPSRIFIDGRNETCPDA